MVEAGGWVHKNSLYYFLIENFIIESHKKFSMWHDDILLIFFKMKQSIGFAGYLLIKATISAS